MARPITPQSINLKATINNAGICQASVSDHFKIRAQQVNKWCNGGNISKEWQAKLQKFFKNKSIEVINYN